MYTIENNDLVAAIHPRGAELQSIYGKKTGVEYMWSGDAAYWNKKSPVLFPIVGTLKNDTYYYHGKAYSLSRHGFAREMMFVVSEQTGNSIGFTLESNQDTMFRYPFPFRFTIGYTLQGNVLQTSYQVWNTGASTMYFSVGGHPAFRVPLSGAAAYDDYYLEFTHAEDAGRWPISKEGLIEKTPEPLLEDSIRLPLSKALFWKDAVVFKHLLSHGVRLQSDKDPHGLWFDFTGFPYLGIWAAKNADFVCIEPWYGIADSVDASQQLEEKEGIQSLPPEQCFENAWSITLF